MSGRRGTDMMGVVRGWLARSFAGLTYEVHAVTSGDGLVMIWFTSSGTHICRGFPQFAGRKPTGRRIVAEAVHIFRVRDDLGMLRQLDGGDPPGERPRRQV